MRDSVEMESRGIPTVTIAHHNFENAARNQAKALGMPSLPLVIIEQPRPWHDEAFKSQEVERCMEVVKKALTKAKGVPAT